MFRAYFGDLTTGRLPRLPFLGFILLLSVLFVFYGLGIAFGIGVAVDLLRGDLEATGGYLVEHLALPWLLALALFVLVFGFAKWNLIAKRIRDMGLPGWRTVILFALAEAGLGAVIRTSGESLGATLPIHAIISGLVTAGLLLIPSNLFAPRPAADPATEAPNQTALAD